MCKPVNITTGAMLVALLTPKAVFVGTIVLGTGIALVVTFGSGLSAFMWMAVTFWAAVTTILLLRRRADPVRRVVTVPARAPQRTRVELVASRRALELEAGAPAVTYTITEQRAVR